MAIRIASVTLSVAGSIALVSGLLFWTGAALNLISMHMMLGFVAVGALWVIGVGQTFSQNGSWMVAVSALLVGAMMIFIGLNQSSLMVGEFHWVIRVIHLVMGILTIGIGHMGAARYRKTSGA